MECGNQREGVSLLWHEIITVFYEKRNRLCSALQEHEREGNYLKKISTLLDLILRGHCTIFSKYWPSRIHAQTKMH